MERFREDHGSSPRTGILADAPPIRPGFFNQQRPMREADDGPPIDLCVHSEFVQRETVRLFGNQAADIATLFAYKCKSQAIWNLNPPSLTQDTRFRSCKSLTGLQSDTMR